METESGPSQARSVDDHQSGTSLDFHVDPVSKKLIRDRRSSRSDKDTPPDFITKPRRQFVEEGQTAKFKASFDGPPTTKLTWSKNGQLITNDKQHRIYCENDVHYLDICAVTSENGGTYTCTLQNSGGSTTASAELEVFVKPKSASRKGFVSPQVDVPLTDLYVSNGERNVKMECKFSNAIDATCVWRRNGQKLNSSYLSKQTFDGRLATLTLNRVTDRETGSYECEASSSGGSAVTKATLSISDSKTRHVPPKFVTPLSDHTLSPGEKLILESRVSGYPQPTIKWYKNREELKATKSVQIEFDNPLVRLTMSNVQISDGDTYKCVAENDAGRDQIKANITVKDTNSQGEPPVFVKELTDMNADEGDKVELVVEVRGTPPIYVAWLHREKEIQNNDPDFRILSENNLQKLIIPEVFLEDSGKFVCEAYNEYGDTETFCTLNVRETEKSLCMQQTSEMNNESSAIESLDQSDSDKSFKTSRSDSGFVEQFGQKPDFVLKPRSVEVDPGISAIFLCRPSGNPPPSVTWKKQGEVINNDNKHRISSGVDCYLEIRAVTAQDSGIYICELTNLLGSVSTETNLIVRNSILEKSLPSDVQSLLRKSSVPSTPPPSISTSSPIKSTERKEQIFAHRKTPNLPPSGEKSVRPTGNINSGFTSLRQSGRENSVSHRSGSVSKQIDKWQKLDQKPPKSPVSVDYRSVLKSRQKVDGTNQRFPDDGSTDGRNSLRSLNKSHSGRESSTQSIVRSPHSPLSSHARSSEGDIFQFGRRQRNTTQNAPYSNTQHDNLGSKVSALKQAFSEENLNKIPTGYNSPEKSHGEVRRASIQDLNKNVNKWNVPSNSPKSERRCFQKNLSSIRGTLGEYEKNDHSSSKLSEDKVMLDTARHRETSKVKVDSNCVTTKENFQKKECADLSSSKTPKKESDSLKREPLEMKKEVSVEEDFRTVLDKRRENSPYRFKKSDKIEKDYPKVDEEPSPSSLSLREKLNTSSSPHNFLKTPSDLPMTSPSSKQNSNFNPTNQNADTKNLKMSSNQNGDTTVSSYDNQNFDIQDMLEKRRQRRNMKSSFQSDQGYHSNCDQHNKTTEILDEKDKHPYDHVKTREISESQNQTSFSRKKENAEANTVLCHSKAAENVQSRIMEDQKRLDKDAVIAIKAINEFENRNSENYSDRSSTSPEDFRSVLSKRRESDTNLGKRNSPKVLVQNDFRHVLKRHVDTKSRQLPTFRSRLTDHKVKEGQPVTMECKVTGIPKPDITWFMNGKTIKPSKFFRMTYEDNLAKLVIDGAYPEDDGEYTCTASNSVGTERCSCRLYVQELFNDQSTEDPVQSTFDKTPYGPDLNDSSVTKTTVVTKETSNSSENESEYTSDENVPREETSRLVAPCIHEINPDSVTKGKGQKVMIQVSFLSEDKPTVTWFKDQKDIEPGDDIFVSTTEHFSRLTIPNLRKTDAGQYEIVVQNSIGSTSANSTIHVEDVPDPPACRPAASEVKLRSIIVTWSGPAYDGGSQVTGYKVEICEAEEEIWQTLTDNCHSTSYLAENLHPHTPYFFRVSAKNKYGYGKPSEVSAVIVTRDQRLEIRLSIDSDDVFVTSPTSTYSGSMFSPFSTMSVADDDLPFDPRLVSISQDRVFEDAYDLKEEVGKGKFGKVFKCTEKTSGQTFAAKILRCRTSREKETIRQEVEIMNQLTHPKLLMLWDAFEAAKNMILVMEYVAGGELFDRVADEDLELTERDCVHFVRQICNGVQYMHTKSIIHLDLKPENILCVHKDNNLIKIIDFGLARVHTPGESLKAMCGTPEFIAPEVVNYEEVGLQTDIWSLGVICYVLLSGLSPFMGDSDIETLANVTRGDFDYDDEAFDEISGTAKDFINKTLKKDKGKRLTVDQCLDHRWLGQAERNSSKKLRQSLRNLKQFMARRKWQKMGNAIRAVGRMSSAMQKLQKARSGSESSVNTDSDASSQTEHPLQPSRSPTSRSSPWRQEEVSSELGQTGDLAKCTSNGNQIHRDLTKQNGDICVKSTPKNQNEHSQQSNLRNVQYETSQYSRTKRKPTFVKEMVDCEAFIGDVVRFDVKISWDSDVKLMNDQDGKISDDSDLRMEWYFEDQLIKQDHQHSFVYSLNENGECSLIIKNVSEINEGEYICLCKNKDQEIKCCAELSIYGGAAI